MNEGTIKPRPSAIGLENIANQMALWLPDFSHMDAHDERRCVSALNVIAAVTQSMRAILGSACPSCGAVVMEGELHA